MHSEPAKDPIHPEGVKREMRQIHIKMTGKVGSDKITLTKRHVEILLGANEENKALRAEVLRLTEVVKKLKSTAVEPEVIECVSCGRRLTGGKVCGNPVCKLYGGKDDDGPSVPNGSEYTKAGC